MKKDYRNEFSKIKYLMNYNILKEYSADQRLPFDDDEFKNKNYFEQYLDWLEDFGKYGTLPKSKLDFWDEVKKAIKHIIDNNLKNHAGLGLSDNPDKVFDDLSKIIANHLYFNNDGNLYVEREVQINGSIIDYDNSVNGKDPIKLYNKLVKNYNNNVGGCWSYRKDNAESYCTKANGDSIVLKGYIRTDDIDFVKTVLLNFHYSDEHEIRTKPNAKVELIEVICNCKYKLPLKKNLIVSATYFGNNGKYDGDYAPVDNGFGYNDYMDRKGNIKTLNQIVKELLSKGGNLNDIFNTTEKYKHGFTDVTLNGKETLVKPNGELIGNGKLWFTFVWDFQDNFAKAYIDGKETLINTDGELIGNGKLWFDEIYAFQDGYAKVKLDNKFSLINKNGELIGDNKLWFNNIEEFKNNFAIVRLNNRFSFLNINGNLIGNGNLWFDYLYNFEDNFAIVGLDIKETLIKPNGELIGNGNLWFDGVYKFSNGLAVVELNKKESYLNTKGELIGNGKVWFDTAYDFGNNGLGKVELNGNYYYIDKSINFYDYETKQLIPNPLVNQQNENIKNFLKSVIKEEINNFLKNKKR